MVAARIEAVPRNEAANRKRVTAAHNVVAGRTQDAACSGVAPYARTAMADNQVMAAPRRPLQLQKLTLRRSVLPGPPLQCKAGA
jgi:hypothetical protein